MLEVQKGVKVQDIAIHRHKIAQSSASFSLLTRSEDRNRMYGLTSELQIVPSSIGHCI